MTELVALKQRRGRAKAQVTRIETFFNQNHDITAIQAALRLKKLEEASVSFEAAQGEIDDLPHPDPNTQVQFIAEQEEERQNFEDKYFDIAARAQQIIERARVEIPQLNTSGNQRQGDEARIVTQERRDKPKLPNLKLPTFSGDYTKWLFWKNNYETTIHDDTDLTNMRKHQYLIGLLEGDARKVIEGFTISNENYDSAWALLKNTYDNQMMIIETHLEDLMEFPSITRENKADSIRQLVWHIQTHISSLKTLSQPVEHWDTVIIHLAKKKLDYIEQKDWQNTIEGRTPQNMPKLEEFMAFLTQRCHTLRMLGQNKQKEKLAKEKPVTQKKDKKSENNKFEKRAFLTSNTGTCRVCKQDHPTYRCNEVNKLSPRDRKSLIIEKQLCINCLGPGHQASACTASTCKKCHEKHNTVLHDESRGSETYGESTVSAALHSQEPPLPDLSSMTFYVTKPTSYVILSTAQIYIYNSRGEPVVCRALLDPGSQVNLMTVDLARKLKLPFNNSIRSISGVNRNKSESKKSVLATLKAKNNDFCAEMECLLLPSITENLPQNKININRIIIPQGLNLADPTFNEPGKIDVLLGAGLYWKVLLGRPVNKIEGQPSLQNTHFGWIVGGEMDDCETSSSSTCLKITNDQLSDQLERFWKQEAVVETQHLTKEERECEKHFNNTYRRDKDGRFIVRLPIRTYVTLGDSRVQAQRRLEALERRFKRDPGLKETYRQFMEEYINTKHMSLVQETKALESKEVYYIPHQAVIRPDSISTKLRVVFDASAKTTSGTSLNDKLSPGPNLQNDLLQIVLRFRTHAYVITADITKMFRQLFVDDRDRNYQLILWRNEPDQPIQVYQLNTVTYGTACAPYHAMRCLRELAVLHRESYPIAASVIDNDFYMDDVLTGASSIDQAIQLQKDLTELLMLGQFPLKKWRSNNPQVLEHLVQLNEMDPLLTLNKDDTMKTLGLYWNSAKDNLQYRASIDNACSNTKRKVLSKISQVFDPLGLITPVLIQGKIIMQQLWMRGIEWDQTLPEDQLHVWQDYQRSLSQLNELEIPRNVILGNKSSSFDIFGFGDASELAYGACLYAISVDELGIRHSHLLCAKSRVAPVKTISIPRLELEAALLLSQLYQTAKQTFNGRIDRVRLWSDSTVVLGWIRAQPQTLKTFVANRVTKIQELTEGTDWNHVPTSENPADLISRGSTVENIRHNNLWWHGPCWLLGDHQFPHRMEPAAVQLPELKTTSVSLVVITPGDVLRRFSSYSKLCRVIAYCRRFIQNLRSSKVTGPIQPAELSRAEETVASWTQAESFSSEIRCIQNQTDLPRKSPLIPLRSFLDSKGIIRVGGRLKHADIPISEKHQIVLPAKHHITRIIMREKHLELQHCPPEQLLHTVREKFWPISGRKEAQRTVRSCVKCFRYRPTIPTVMMGDLPPQRVQAFIRPFTTTGVDYAGPFQVRESHRRGRVHVTKGYVAVFTCFSTKAVHLEMVSDLTSEAFLATLSRFTARRGLCSHIFSDNGTNFVGAARELQEVFELLSREEKAITIQLAKQRITWSFIPPRAPHFGGLWEAAVKAMKRHLSIVTEGKMLTFEEYSTLLANIEAVLNSRPLTPLTNDPLDFSVLTPSHFLINDSLIQPVHSDFLSVADNKLSRWQHLQKLRQQLWVRWKKEYLQELQKRSKWCTPGPTIELNMMVLLIEDNVSPLHWSIGRIIELHPGSDNVVRVVTVRTARGQFKRAVKKLCPLPIDNE